MKTILVTGGAGYIGSITAKKLLDEGLKVVIMDNLERGNPEVIDLLGCPFFKADLRDKESLKHTFKNNNFDAVVHFAAYPLAGESMEKTYEYFENNIVGSLNLLQTMRTFDTKKIIFSSSCSIYGTPQKLPVDEDAPEHPESPYAESKRIVEKLLKWFSMSYGFSTIALRYFNASGALMDGSMGQYDKPHFSHIIPLAVKAVLEGKTFTIYGNDYQTPDGTCIRDYIHVEDLAVAHLLALKKIDQAEKGSYDYYNLGVGKGHSNQEIIEAIKRISGSDLKVKIGPRRPGDPAAIYGDNQKAKKELGWEPQYGLEEIIESAYRWHKEHPFGYQSSSSRLPEVQETTSRNPSQEHDA